MQRKKIVALALLMSVGFFNAEAGIFNKLESGVIKGAKIGEEGAEVGVI